MGDDDDQDSDCIQLTEMNISCILSRICNRHEKLYPQATHVQYHSKFHFWYLRFIHTHTHTQLMYLFGMLIHLGRFAMFGISLNREYGIAHIAHKSIQPDHTI